MKLTIGDLQVSHVEELSRVEFEPDSFLADLPDGAVAGAMPWLAPNFGNADTGMLYAAIHSWVVRTRHHIVLIDACAGNDKERPTLPMMDHLHTPWLSRLAALGIAPEQVDYVMCTHLHADHVGWNTRLIDGRWVPTFPNARYLFARREFDHWNPRGGDADREGMDQVFNDSVLPCAEAGLVTLVDDGYTLDDALHVENAHGHTAGNVLIRGMSAGETALFTGDCFHSPLQLAYPEVNSRACEFPEMARATRRRILAEAAEGQHLLVPAHFPAPYVGYVTADGDGFKFRAKDG